MSRHERKAVGELRHTRHGGDVLCVARRRCRCCSPGGGHAEKRDVEREKKRGTDAAHRRGETRASPERSHVLTPVRAAETAIPSASCEASLLFAGSRLRRAPESILDRPPQAVARWAPGFRTGADRPRPPRWSPSPAALRLADAACRCWFRADGKPWRNRCR